MGHRSTVARFVKERDVVSMGRRNAFVRFVKEAQFLMMINKRVFVWFAVEVHCARPHCVRRRPTGSTKDIAYVVKRLIHTIGVHSIRIVRYGVRSAE